MQVAEEPPTVVFSGDSEVVGDSVIDAIRAAVGKNEVILTWYGEPEEVSLSEDTDLGTTGLVLSTVPYQIHSTRYGYLTGAHQTGWNAAGDEYPANSPATVIIDGKGRTIALTGTNTVKMPLITVGEGVTLELRNITFKGMDSNQATLIQVSDKGTLIMQSGAHLTDNENKRILSPYSHGGGVRVETGGTFTMNDGTIRDNTAGATDGRGGGVAVYGGTFTMKGGIISDNTTSFTFAYGGGVSVLNSGTFIMEGGFIEHNTAKNSGGGVAVEYSNFTKKGGTIYGTKKEDGNGAENSDKINTSGNSGEPGSAVYRIDSNYIVKLRETTAGPTKGIDTTAGGYDPDTDPFWVP
jgi:hypothetical protein